MEIITEQEILLLQNVIGDRGKLIFAMVCGSTAFHLAMPTSDRDLFGIYLMNESGPFVSVKDSMCSSDPDYAIHEVGKYVQMLEKGNPKVLEPLYCRFSYSTDEWDQIHQYKASVLNKITSQQYISYASQQRGNAERKGEGGYKFYAHCLRLLMEVKNIVQGIPPRVYFDGEEREYLMCIRRNEIEVDEILGKIHDLREEVSQLLADCSLPDRLSLRDLSQWLIPLRTQMLHKVQYSEINTINELVGSGVDSLRDMALDYITKNNINAKLLFVGPTGANAYNHNTDTNDFLGVFIYTTDEHYSPEMTTPPIIFQYPETSSKKYGKGLVFYELSYFFEQLTKGEHSFIELLSRVNTDPTTSWISQAWSDFVMPIDPSCFFTKAVIFQYAGLCTGFLQRAKRDTKNRDWCMYLAARMSHQAKRILTNNQIPNSIFPEDIQTELINIKSGHYDYNQVEQSIIEQTQNIQDNIPNNFEENLSETRALISRWILSLRRGL